MQKQSAAVAILFAALLVFSGCIQLGGKNFSDLKAINEKHDLDGIIAPGSLTELDDFEKDLLSLKAQASVQKNRQTEALVAMLDYRIATAEMQRAFLKATEESRFIDYYHVSCTQETSLKKTIEYFDNALTQADLSVALANNFSNNYNDFLQQADFDLAKETKTINEFKAILQERKNSYKAFCT